MVPFTALSMYVIDSGVNTLQITVKNRHRTTVNINRNFN